MSDAGWRQAALEQKMHFYERQASCPHRLVRVTEGMVAALQKIFGNQEAYIVDEGTEYYCTWEESTHVPSNSAVVHAIAIEQERQPKDWVVHSMVKYGVGAPSLSSPWSP